MNLDHFPWRVTLKEKVKMVTSWRGDEADFQFDTNVGLSINGDTPKTPDGV